MFPLTDPLGSAFVSDGYIRAAASGQRFSASLVVDVQGNTTDAEGGSKLLGGEMDLIWLRTLRSRAQLVATGGNTYRTEQYKMPRFADLAVFSRSPVQPPQGFEGSPRFLSRVGNFPSVTAELRQLSNQYKSIHLEFGPEMLIRITRELGLGIWISSQFGAGIDKFCAQNNLMPVHRFSISDLSIAYCR